MRVFDSLDEQNLILMKDYGTHSHLGMLRRSRFIQWHSSSILFKKIVDSAVLSVKPDASRITANARSSVIDWALNRMEVKERDKWNLFNLR